MMKKLQLTKWTLALTLALLSMSLGLILLPSRQAQANPPNPTPPPPIFTDLEPPYPPPESPSAFAPISIQGTVKTFQAVADAEVRQSNPATNYGISPTMGAGYDAAFQNTQIGRTLVHFDISSFLPPGTTVHQATLRLYLAGYCDTGSSTFRTYRLAQNWSELTVTWNNQPPFAEGYGSALIPVGPFGWYNFDVTALAQAWLNGTHPEHGIMIRGPETALQCAARIFRSKGGGGFTTAPELVIDYTLPPPTLAVSQNDIIISHQCGAGAPPPATQIIAVQSTSSSLNNWTATTVGGGSWLSLSKTSGKVSSIFPDQIEISFSETALCPDTVSAEIQINAAGLGSSPQTINITFQQSENPPQLVYLPIIVKGGVGQTATATAIYPAATTPVNRIALIIGVADYKYLQPPAGFSLLRGGVWGTDILAGRGDGREMSSMLKGDYDVIVVLTEANATKANIDYALQWLDEREGPDTDVLLYFSGHGGPINDQPPLDEADQKDELLGVYDTNDTPQFVDYVLDDNFKNQLANLETQHLAVIIDACNSQGMEVTNPNRAVLAASREDQNSWESSELEHGVFTYYMLQAMLDPTSDTNGDGWLSVQEIYNDAQAPVSNYVMTNEGVDQNLTLNMTSDVKVKQISQ